ncbi:hypothetical protein [Nonomuraea sp. NPDC052265]|uniref:hypothetical protein n=1 Tax=Nonomuraea sp. NPDC052265 TaxID=3364374 RepID=UPI0037CA5669
MSLSSEKTILVVNSGDGTGLNFTRSLGLAGGYRVVGVDTTIEDFHTSEAESKHFLAWSEADEFVEAVNKIADMEGADLVYAADTGPQLMVISERRDDLNRPTLLPDQVDHWRMEDKWATWEAMQEAGLPVPDTALATDRESVAAFIDKHVDIWLRRRRGSGGSGALATASLELAQAWLDEHHGWHEFTVAQKLTTRTATFSGLWYEGDLLCSQLRERLSWKYPSATASGVTGVTGVQHTLWDEQLHDLAVRCVRATCARPHGIIGVDFTYDHDGNPLPTEVQPARFYSSIFFLAQLGVNLPDLYCRLALGELDVPAEPSINPIRDRHYWVKAVDRLPQLMSPEEFQCNGNNVPGGPAPAGFSRRTRSE